jgi:hypothetical protein
LGIHKMQARAAGSQKHRRAHHQNENASAHFKSGKVFFDFSFILDKHEMGFNLEAIIYIQLYSHI